MKIALPKPIWALISLYALSGILLFMLVPTLDEMNSFWIADWKTSPSPLVKAYHLPSLIWLLIGGGFAGLIYWLNIGKLSIKTKKLLNVLMMVLWLIAFVHIIDWLTMFMFCHKWGCSGGFSPTWHWLGLI